MLHKNLQADIIRQDGGASLLSSRHRYMACISKHIKTLLTTISIHIGNGSQGEWQAAMMPILHSGAHHTSSRYKEQQLFHFYFNTKHSQSGRICSPEKVCMGYHFKNISLTITHWSRYLNATQAKSLPTDGVS